VQGEGLDNVVVRVEEAGRNEAVIDEIHSADAGFEHPLSAEETCRVLIVAGATGGHIFPALTVAQELRARESTSHALGMRYRIEFLATHRALEARLIPAAGFPVRTVAAAGLKGIGGLQKARNLLLLPRTAVQAAGVLREFKPRVVVGVGGYLAGPVMLLAALRDIPTLLIEPNACPGFTNRLLAPLVHLAAVGFASTADFYGAKARVTGHAVRKAFHQIPTKLHTSPFTILIVGGSQGSRAINEAVVGALPLLEREATRLKIIHQTGERDYDAVRKAYQGRGAGAVVQAFIEDMPGAFAQADLVVSRAGATAVSELAAAAKASLLIPFPGATDQHQLENAKTAEQAGAARVIVQADLTPERLLGEIRDLLDHPEQLIRMEHCARSLARPDAAERIADLVEELASL
jgi:UDP-N-acetylglucosamine--N-acetylmuramyl-(pentapeptide) pyrophosphoryl-undecaprenol N-acetylglucosamine transferase